MKEIKNKIDKRVSPLKGRPSPLKGRPSPLKGRPSPMKGYTFPHLWAAGPDPALRPIWRKWLVAKNQARFRGEEWALTWDQYRNLIQQTAGNWGRQNGCYNISRTDRRLGWHIDNVTLVQRSEIVAKTVKQKSIAKTWEK